MLPEGGQAEAMATIFVWLRYSSSRQLTWQRNYNTQPRILGEAQSRLTHAIAEVAASLVCCSAVQICNRMPDASDHHEDQTLHAIGRCCSCCS